MADTTNTAQGQAQLANNGQPVPLPNGQQVTIQVRPGERVLIDFDPSTAQVSREGNDLVLKFEDGGQITLAGFAAAAETGNPPSIMLADGQTVIAGDVLVAQLGDGDPTDLETAAGGDAGGGGGSSYSDDFGNTIDPFGAQGPLDPTPFPISVPEPDDTEGPLDPPVIADRSIFLQEDTILMDGNGLIPDNTNFEIAPGSIGTFGSPYGDLTINADGTFEFVLNNSTDGDGDNIVQRLAEGETVTLRSEVDLVDPATGESATQNIDIIIQGVNDEPIANFDANEVTAGMVAYEDHDAMTAPIITGNVLQDVAHGDETADRADVDIDNNAVVTVYSVRPVSTSPANVAEQEAAHDSIGTAQSLDGLFSLTTDPLTDNGGVIPHVSIEGTGGGEGSGIDYYAFTVTQAGSSMVLDVDFGGIEFEDYMGFNGSFDSFLTIYDAEGAIVTTDQDSGIDPGSDNFQNFTFDSGKQYIFEEPGTYYVAISNWDGNPMPENSTYILNLDLENAVTGGAGGAADADVPLGNGTEVLAGAYGTLTIDADGSYSYDLNDTNATVVALDDGQKIVDTFEYTITDEHGAMDTAALQIIVTGNNDGPTAIADTNYIDLGATSQSGQFTDDIAYVQSSAYAGGNVLMDGEHGGGTMDVADTDPDTTDTLSVVAVADGEAGEGGIVANGVYGTLYMQADGSYDYYIDNVNHPDLVALGEEDQATDTFTYTASDGDKEASTTLTIYIQGVDEVSVSVTDGEVFESALGDVDASGNVVASVSGHIGSDPDSDAENDSGTTDVAPPNANYTMTVDGVSVPVDGNAGSSQNIQGQYGTLTMFGDGSWSYTLDTPVNEDTVVAVGAESFEVIVTEGSFNSTDYIDIDIVDDVPSVVADGEYGTLNVDETDFAVNASGGFASAFSVEGGADGVDDLEYSLSVDNSSTALFDTLTEELVTLAMDGNDVVGSSATGGEVFRVSVDVNTGVVTLNQTRAIVHSDNPDNYDETQGIGSDLIGLTATDGDGDMASDSIDLGAALSIDDDGPSVSVDGEGPNLIVDETNFATNASGSFASVFGVDAGNDGEDDLGYALSVDEADSGLVDTLTEQDVTLSMDGNDVVGKNDDGDVVFRVSVDDNGLVTLDQSRSIEHPNTASHNETLNIGSNLISLTATVTDGDDDTADNSIDLGAFLYVNDDGPSIDGESLTGAALDETDTGGVGSTTGTLEVDLGADGGAVALSATDATWDSNTDTLSDDGGEWKIVVNGDGTYTFHQLTAVDHGSDGNDHDATASWNITATATDGDDDTAVASFTVSIDDDGPQVSAGGASMDETGGIGSTSGSLSYDLGTDSAGGLALSATDATWNGSDTLTDDDGEWQIVVNNDDTYTFTQLKAVDHGNDGNDHNSTASWNITATATDGDTDSAVATFTVSIDDDGPSIGLNASFTASLNVDETDFDTDASGSYATAFTSSGGTDGAAGIGYSLTVDAAASGLTDSMTGQPVTLALESDDVVGRNTDGDEVFRVSVDGSGVVTLDQSRGVVHPDPTMDNETLALTTGLVSLVATITDGDGDTASTNTDIGATLSFNDDAPVIDTLQNMVVANETGTYKGEVDFDAGGDGFASFNLSNNFAEPPEGLTYTVYGFGDTLPQVAIDAGLSVADAGGSLLVATQTDGGDVVFGLAIDSSGEYCFDLIQALEPVITTIGFGGMPPGNYPGGLYYDVETDSWSDTAPTDAELLVTGSSTLNVSGQGFGDGNNHFEEGQVLTFDFFTDVSGVSIMVDRALQVSEAEPLLVSYDVYNGAVLVYSGTSNVEIHSDDQIVDFIVPEGIEFDQLTITGVDNLDGDSTEKVTFNSITYSQTELPSDLNLAFNLGLTDGDGDNVDGPLYIDVVGGTVDATMSDNLAATYDDDILIGGLGQDTLSSGDGNDIFRYSAVDETPVDAGDIITDLSTDDMIDLSGLLDSLGADPLTSVDAANDANALLQVSVSGSVVAEITVEGWGSTGSLGSGDPLDVLNQVDDGS